MALLLCLALLTAIGVDAIYTLQGTSTQGALLRQSENEKELKLVVQDVEHKDCVAKFNTMNISPFTFYRGSNQIYYKDLASQNTIARSAFYDPKATPWIQGDMHVLNAGRFDNDMGIVVYDLNDFDEAFVANYLYDVYRLATSIILVARNNSLQEDDAVSCAEAFASSYREQLKKLAKGDAEPYSLDAHSASGPVRELLTDKDGGELGGRKNQRKQRIKMLDKWSRVNKDKRREFLTDSEDLEPVTKAERKDIENAMKRYYKKTVRSVLRGDEDYFAVQDIARRRNAGTGSLGTQRYYVLIAGDSASDPDDDRVLDVKYQGRPSIYPYLTPKQLAAVYDNVDNDADRVAEGYKALIPRSDDHLGYMMLPAGNFSVRERSPYKKALELTSAVDPETQKLTNAVDAKALEDLAEQWGIMLANAHARSTKGYAAMGTPKSFEGLMEDMLHGRRREFMGEISTVATTYAKQVQHDYDLFLDSLESGNMCGGAAGRAAKDKTEL